MAAALLLAATATGCATRNVPLTSLEVPLPTVPIPGLPLLGPGQDDLRFMRWERAFEKMHARMRAEYAYTDWKGVDWDALQAEFAPQAAKARKARNADAWYELLAAYVARIPDDKVRLSPKPGTETNEGDFLGDMLEEPVAARRLPEGPGYIRIRFFAPSLATPFPGRAFSRALGQVAGGDAPGLILDLRNNPGGADDLAAEFAGHFTTWQDEAPPTFCKLAEYSQREDAFVTRRVYPVNPADPGVDVPTVVLVDGATAGAAELLARFLQDQGATIVGTVPTQGSVGIPGGSLTLPKGHVLSYPTGRVLNAADEIIVERDAAGNGGVLPDVLLPRENGDSGDPLLAHAVALLTPNADSDSAS